ncbi:MAG: PaREP1 family protein [bacterium]
MKKISLFDSLIKEGEEMLRLASSELKEAEENKDETQARQAAEKAYLALIKSFNAFFVKKGKQEEDLPKTDRGRRYFLHSLAGKDLENFYAALRAKLHIDAFHDGLIIFESIEEDIKSLSKFIEEVKDGKK